MTVLQRTPDNVNILQPTKYLVTFDRIPDTQYFCQKANIPGATMPEAKIDSPFHNYTVAGLNIQYNKINLDFIIDESLLSWRNIYEWMLAISSPVSFEERNYYKAKQNPKPNPFPSYSDMTLTVMSGLNNPVVRVQFYNAFPIYLSDIDFDTTLSADHTMTAQASFNYEFYEFVEIT